jgi:hypothetical protein
VPDQRGARRSPGGYRTSVLGRVDWSCWLAAAGLLFLTVVSVLVQFAILGVITAILAVGIVAFDSWINRPKGFRAARLAAQGRPTGAGGNTGWRANSAVNNRARRPAQNFRRPTTVGQPQPQRQPPRPLNGQPPRQPPRQPPGQQRQQPPRQPPPPLGQPPVGQPPLGQPQGQPPQGQPPQGQPPRPPFRPSPPDPGRARR